MPRKPYNHRLFILCCIHEKASVDLSLTRTLIWRFTEARTHSSPYSALLGASDFNAVLCLPLQSSESGGVPRLDPPPPRSTQEMVFVTASVGSQHREGKLQLPVKPHFPPRGGAGPLLSSAGLVTTKAFPVSRSPRRFLPPSGSSGHYSVPGEVTQDTSQPRRRLLQDAARRRCGRDDTDLYGGQLFMPPPTTAGGGIRTLRLDIHTTMWQAGCGRPQPSTSKTDNPLLKACPDQTIF